jgi:hypothetical protein
MVRTSLSVHARLMRVQAVRQKREAIDGAANQDASTQHVAEQSMLQVADPDIKRLTAASPRAAPGEVPKATPAAYADQGIKNHVSISETNSQDAAFETWLSAQRQDPASDPPDGGHLHEVGREAMAEPRSAGRDPPANGRESPGRTGQSSLSAEPPDGARSGRPSDLPVMLARTHSGRAGLAS